MDDSQDVDSLGDIRVNDDAGMNGKDSKPRPEIFSQFPQKRIGGVQIRLLENIA